MLTGQSPSSTRCCFAGHNPHAYRQIVVTRRLSVSIGLGPHASCLMGSRCEREMEHEREWVCEAGAQ